jgi:hypothetical protein
MAKKIIISVPEDLYKEMEEWRETFNLSKIFLEALQKEIAKKRLFRLKMEEEKTPEEIFEAGDFDTPEEQFKTGKEMGFSYAKNSPYHVIKPLEEYIEGLEKKDKETINRISYTLDIASILDRLGFVEHVDNIPDSIETTGFLSTSFDLGFIQGVMEFIQKEYTSIEVSKLASERGKKLCLAKDEKERIRILAEYKPKFDELRPDPKKRREKKTKKKGR